LTRAKQEIDYGRRDVVGYVFGALQPATGDAFTATYEGRTIVNWIDFLGQVETWIDATVDRVYAVVDNLNTHTALDVLLFSLAHPRWEFVFQPKYAAYLNLIEPWWKVLRSLALKGRRFEPWAEIEQAVARATAYWNAHKHPFIWPFIWGRRRRHCTPRRLGIAALPNVPLI
jgi:transposase